MDNLKTNHWKITAAILIPLGLLWIFISSNMPGISSNENTSAPQVGFKAPDIALLNSAGEEVKLSDLGGKVVMVNFWASWCGPCTREMPTMQDVYSKYNEQGFEILAINTTFQDQRSEAELFVQENHLSFPILYDITGGISRDYNLYSTPMSFFIDADGIIRNIIPGGPISEASLISNIEALLQEEN